MTPHQPLSDDEFSQHLQRALQALPDVPLALQRAAIGLWPAAATTTTTTSPLSVSALAQALMNRIRASLTFDSWAAPAMAAGMRSLRSPTRHLLYTAQGRDVDLRITPVAGAGVEAGQESFTVSGQILGPDESGSVLLTRCEAHHRQSESASDKASDSASGSASGSQAHAHAHAHDPTASATLDALGEFRIDAVPPGRYQLVLQLGPDAIELPALQLGEPPLDPEP